jgi:diacylglycerol O-acyltransferase
MITIERATPGDLAMRARSAGGGSVPERLGAVLVLEPPVLPTDDLRRLLGARLATVPRLRQRLARVPPGGGGPIWVEDNPWDPDVAVGVRRCAGPGDEQALLALAAELACQPAAPTGRLWSATIVPDLAGGRSAVVLVLDHLLVDGLGGLAALGHLVDGAPPAATSAPQPRPGYRALLADALVSRLRGVRRIPVAWRAALRTGGAVRGPRAVPCSLLAPTGLLRQFAVARADLAAVHGAAAAAGATVDDALLAAVGGALHDLLASRGDAVEQFRVAVMVAVRRSAPDALGNAVAPLVVGVPASGTVLERLRLVAGNVRRHRGEVADPLGAGVLVWLLRCAATLGLYRRWLRRQRLFHTSLSDLIGPRAAVALGNSTVSGIVPFAVGDPGNVTVSFLCLSYAGTLTVTAVADPEALPDLPVLQRALQSGLDELCAAARPP